MATARSEQGINKILLGTLAGVVATVGVYEVATNFGSKPSSLKIPCQIQEKTLGQFLRNLLQSQDLTGEV